LLKAVNGGGIENAHCVLLVCAVPISAGGNG